MDVKTVENISNSAQISRQHSQEIENFISLRGLVQVKREGISELKLLN